MASVSLTKECMEVQKWNVKINVTLLCKFRSDKCRKTKKKDLVCTNKVNCNLFGATETFYSCVFISFYSSNVCIKNSTAFLDKHQRNFK